MRRAAFPARSMAVTQGALSVPILRTRAADEPAISSTSSGAWAMTGEAPKASRALAVRFMAT